MGRVFQLAVTTACKFIISQTIRPVMLHGNRARIPAPFVIVCTHIGHLEPFFLSALLKRKIDWMARIEFFRHPRAADLLRRCDAFPVDRDNVAHSPIRTALQRLRMGRVVGIFPEGGVKTGPEAAFRGGPIKGGAAVVAQRARVPILPIVILGTDKLKQVDPWLPMRRGRIWINVGRLIHPVDHRSFRVARERNNQLILTEFARIYHETLKLCDLKDSDTP